SDRYAATFSIVGPKITAQSVTGNNNLPGTVNSLQVTFNESMNPLTFIPSKITDFHGLDGMQIPITGVSAVTGSNNTRFNITFAPLTATGPYTMVIGPDIQDIFGNPMDQDGDFIPDAYTAQFGIAGLRVNSSTPTGSTTLPSTNNSVEVTFN